MTTPSTKTASSVKASSTEPHPAFPPVILTPLDVERLLRDESAESRVDVLEKVTHQYNQRVFGEREREVAEQIFRLLMKDAAIRVRETLSERVKNNPEIPRDIALHMAGDIDQVALPMLQQSPVFSDADLVNIIDASNDISKLMAITQRKEVSPRVSDALVETSYPQVVSSLIANDGASISDQSMERIIEDFRGEPAVMETLVQKRQLSLTMVERLITNAGTALSAQLKKKYNLTNDQLKKDSGGAQEDIMLRMLAHDISENEVQMLVNQMAQKGRLNPSLVMTALCRGQLLFFTVALARFAEVKLESAKRLVTDKGEFGFRGLYNKSALPESMFEAVRLLLRVVQSLEGGAAIPGSLLYANRLAERVLAAAGSRQIEYLPYFIALIRQNVQKH